MKPTLFILSSIMLLTIITPTLSQAVDPTATPSPATPDTLNEEGRQIRKELLYMKRGLKGDINEIRKDTKVQLEDNREEVKQQRQSILSAARLQVIEKIYSNAKASLQKRYAYLEETRKKIQEKLTKKSAEGQDISAATKKLEGIPALQKTYTDDMAALEVKYQEMIASDTPWKLMSSLRQAVNKANDDLKQIRRLQIEALVLVVKN